MKLSLQGPSLAFSQGQNVRGEVVGHQDGKSLAVVNGVMTRIPKHLPVGHTFSGSIQQNENGETTLEAQPSERQTKPATTQVSLSQPKLEPTSENRQILDLMKQFGVPVNAETLEEIKRRLPQNAGTLDVSRLRAVLLLLSRNIPDQHLAKLERYFSGQMQLSSLFAYFDGATLENLRKQWGLGKSLEKLTELLQQKLASGGSPADGETALKLSENLFFQTLFEVPASETRENQLYFQWPLFWQGQDVPDTLEGECFFPRKDRENMGFSIRLMVHPPRLGPMEVGIHEFEKALWIHFGVSEQTAREALPGAFEGLRQALLAKGWKSVKLTIGEKPSREKLLEPQSIVASEPEHPELDIKI